MRTLPIRDATIEAPVALTLTVLIPDGVMKEICDRVIAMLAVGDLRPGAKSPYLTTDEAAEYARCTRQRIYDLRSKGVLASYRDGRRVLVLREELDAHLATRTRGP